MDEKVVVAIELYRHMPGAEMPPTEDGQLCWGDVEHTQEWRFCEAIAEAMLSICVRVAQLSAEETVKRMREQAKADDIPSTDDWDDDFNPDNLAAMVDDAAEAVLGKE